MKRIIDSICQKEDITLEELKTLLQAEGSDEEYLYKIASKKAVSVYGRRIFTRGLIEFTNYCKNDCYYCGIRRSNRDACRYRLSKEDILECCDRGYELGFRTFVLQGGEDAYYSDNMICDIVSTIKKYYSDCALTLSIGEKSYESYKRYYDAGADRYLLRHETADNKHYISMHPDNMTLAGRMECLYNLKKIGFQTGCGFMVGSPGQTVDTLYKDLKFIKELGPHMVGIGPFIPQHQTPFGKKEAGRLKDTLILLAIIRLIHPRVLLPATTALGTIAADGREKGILAGANVVMPNLSPVSVRKKYNLYDNKICTDEEAAECKTCLERRVRSIGYEIVTDRGDSLFEEGKPDIYLNNQ